MKKKIIKVKSGSVVNHAERIKSERLQEKLKASIEAVRVRREPRMVQDLMPGTLFTKWNGRQCELVYKGPCSADVLDVAAGTKHTVTTAMEIVSVVKTPDQRLCLDCNHPLTAHQNAKSAQCQIEGCKCVTFTESRPQRQKGEGTMSKVEEIRKLREASVAGAKPKAKVADNSEKKPISKSGAITLFEQPITAVLRWMGKDGFTEEQAQACLDKLKVPALPFKDTVYNQIVAGKHGIKGAPAKLTADQQKQLRDIAKTVKPTEKTPKTGKVKAKKTETKAKGPSKANGKTKVQNDTKTKDKAKTPAKVKAVAKNGNSKTPTVQA